MSGLAVTPNRPRPMSRVALGVALALVAALLCWQAITAGGSPDPLLPGVSASARTLDITVLVFREGLECVLVLSAVTAGMRGAQARHRVPIAWGAAGALAASIGTWFVAVRAVDALADRLSALAVQAATGLLAIIVLLVVMNWFFHRVYWTGWINLHNRRKRDLLSDDGSGRPTAALMFGLAALGFTSVYREGFEVVLFLQSYRLHLGGSAVLGGVVIGGLLASVVGMVTFATRRRLPYKQMLVATGLLLGLVLLVMVGEQAQEMQLAHWLPSTPISSLTGRVPGWAGLWFSVFPTVETLAAQVIAAVLVVGSYVVARARTVRE